MNRNTAKKIRLAMMIFSIAPLAHAVGSGFYLGGQIGQSNTHNVARDVATYSTPPTENVVPSNGGIGGRLFMGYQLNENVAFEGGFTHYASSTYKPTTTTLCNDASIRENGLDLVGKGMLPLSSSFNFFGKFGVTMIKSTMSGSIADAEVETSGCGGHDNASTNYIRPIAGVGMSFDLSQNWVTDVSYTRAFGGGDFKSADLMALGVSYHFTDKFCGQFLC